MVIDDLLVSREMFEYRGRLAAVASSRKAFAVGLASCHLARAGHPSSATP